VGSGTELIASERSPARNVQRVEFGKLTGPKKRPQSISIAASYRLEPVDIPVQVKPLVALK
jgi:hypothetical protein